MKGDNENDKVVEKVMMRQFTFLIISFKIIL